MRTTPRALSLGLCSTVLVLVLGRGVARAQPAFRVADLNTTVPQRPSVLDTSRKLAALGNVFLFAVDDAGAYGAEIWRSDGTLAGTSLLKDICPGSCSSSPSSFTVSNGTLFFTADDGTRGRELWKSDGTPGGTVMVADVLPGRSPWLGDLIDAGGVLFFTADDGVHGLELWTSDGTTDGTHLVKDIAPGTGGSFARFLATSGQRLLFGVTYGTNGSEPWVSDGTEAGTVQVAALRVGAANAIDLDYDPLLSGADAAPAPQGGFLFAADDGTGTALWYTDGLAGGSTTRLAGASSPHEMAVFQGSVYFAASDPAAGVELWKSDGTAIGTARLKDLEPGSNGSDPRELTVAGNLLYFHAKTSFYGALLWKTNGTAIGTVGVAAIAPNAGDAFPVTPGLPSRYQLSALGNDLIFFARDASTLGLWHTDGIYTTKLTDSGLPDFITLIAKGLQTAGGKALFLIGSEIWSSDGTAAGTRRIRDAAVSTSSLLVTNGKLSPRSMSPLAGDGSLFFPATNGASPNLQPWRTNGTPASTSQITTLPIDESNPYGIHPLGSLIFFTNLAIWKSDGTAGGTRSLGGGFPFGNLTELGNSLFYVASDPVSQAQALWKTDGTPEGTVPVSFLSASNDAWKMTSVRGKVFVPGFDNGSGSSLWVSDGTAPGTLHISGLGHGGGGLTQIYSLVDASSTLFFTAFELGYGWEVWRSDGTAAGTMLIKTVQTNENFLNLAGGEAVSLPGGNPFFLVLSDPEAGAELWKSDGTDAGTVRIADINPGPRGSFPHALILNGNKLFFVADDGVHGDELWTSDGTAAGTRMVADILPGPDSSHPDNLVAMGDGLLFSATDGVHGVEPWRTGGRATGTRMIQDIAPGALSSSPTGFTGAGPNAYFAANDNTTGFELWGVPLIYADATFADVPTTYWASGFIEALAASGVTGGCAEGEYCPEALVSRAQMAVLLLAARDGAPPPPATDTRFQDVPAGYWAGPWIEELAREGVIGGCSVNPPLYCPGNSLTRAEMAVLLVGARHETPAPATGTRFTDVPANYWAAPWIEQLAADGITSGCGGGKFCPDQPVTRGEMAVFLVTAFHLPLP